MHASKINLARKMLHQAQSIVAFSGAGLSSESGIPTFRDPQTDGLWGKYDPMKLASPEGFADDPELVVNWYADRRRSVAAALPNPAHYALANKSELINITQNVDDLLERAGANNVIHLHGSLIEDRCHGECGYHEAIDMTNPPKLRSCPQCRNQLRPGVIWFGEMLPQDAFEKAVELSSSCDVLLVIGTSAAIYPASGLIDIAHRVNAKIVVINTEPSEVSYLADIELLGKAGEILPKIFSSTD